MKPIGAKTYDKKYSLTLRFMPVVLHHSNFTSSSKEWGYDCPIEA